MFLIWILSPKHFKVRLPFKLSPMISPPEARHEIVLASISLREIKPPLLWQLIFPEIDSNKISPPIVEPETEPLKFFKFILIYKMLCEIWN